MLARSETYPDLWKMRKILLFCFMKLLKWYEYIPKFQQRAIIAAIYKEMMNQEEILIKSNSALEKNNALIHFLETNIDLSLTQVFLAFQS